LPVFFWTGRFHGLPKILKKRVVSLSGFTGLGVRRGNGANDERSEREEKIKYNLVWSYFNYFFDGFGVELIMIKY